MIRIWRLLIFRNESSSTSLAERWLEKRVRRARDQPQALRFHVDIFSHDDPFRMVKRIAGEP